MKASDLRTAKGYALKENLRRCWHHRLERTARAHFRSWLRWARRSALSPFIKVAEMIGSRLENIVSYFRHPITNGPQEGMNAKLMSIIRAARGYPVAVVYGDATSTDQTNNVDVHYQTKTDATPASSPGYEAGNFDGYAMLVDSVAGRRRRQGRLPFPVQALTSGRP